MKITACNAADLKLLNACWRAGCPAYQAQSIVLYANGNYYMRPEIEDHFATLAAEQNKNPPATQVVAPL